LESDLERILYIKVIVSLSGGQHRVHVDGEHYMTIRDATKFPIRPLLSLSIF